MGRLSGIGVWTAYSACALAGTLGASSAHADPAVLSNLALLDRLTRESVTEIAQELKLEPGEPVTIFSSTPHEGNELVKRSLGAVLAERGHPVTIALGAGEKATVEAAEDAERPAAPASRSATSNPKPAQAPSSNPSGAAVPADTTGTPNLPATSSGDATGTPNAPATSSGDAPSTSNAPAISSEDATSTPNAPAIPNVATTPSNPDTPAKSNLVVPESSSSQAAARPATLPPLEVANGMVLPDGRFPEGVSLDVRVLEFGVRYAEVSRRLLVGPVQFTRIGGVFVETSVLQGPQGRFVQTASAQGHHWDRISGRTRALCEGVQYPYTSPELKAPSLSRYVEPVVVTGIVGSLIYLFYTNQN